MSIASFNQFQKEVAQDSVLQEQINSTAANSPESLGTLVVKLGAERGYSFTLEEIQAAAEAALSGSNVGGMLKDEELEAVSGGVTWLTITPPLVGGTVKATGEIIRETSDGGPTAPSEEPAWRTMRF